MPETLPPLSPASFFSFRWECPRAAQGLLEKKHRLPDVGLFHGRSEVGKVSLGWGEEGLWVTLEVPSSFSKTVASDMRKGDSFELFIDTRTGATASYPTRFCHHFFFLPTPAEGEEEGSAQKGEKTRFRGEDSHPLCESALLEMRIERGKKQTLFHIFLPSSCLHGYAPDAFPQIGFTYRLNFAQQACQTFAGAPEDFALESNPCLWARIPLV